MAEMPGAVLAPGRRMPLTVTRSKRIVPLLL
jgi:hypothetical protein